MDHNLSLDDIIAKKEKGKIMKRSQYSDAYGSNPNIAFQEKRLADARDIISANRRHRIRDAREIIEERKRSRGYGIRERAEKKWLKDISQHRLYKDLRTTEEKSAFENWLGLRVKSPPSKRTVVTIDDLIGKLSEALTRCADQRLKEQQMRREVVNGHQVLYKLNPAVKLHSIVVYNLPKDLDELEVTQLFSMLGDFSHSRIVEPGIAEIYYTDESTAERAIKFFNGRLIDNKAMCVFYIKD